MRMSTLTIRTDPEVEKALESLTRDGRSRSEAVRAAILAADREKRRARMRAEAETIRDDPDEAAASRQLTDQMDTIRAW
jgi:Arc/MetJ-type ribon-helix-helix transcriptional regulator